MTKIELKIGHRTFAISEKDLILDNGNCAQVITQKIFKGWSEYSPTMSKKMFRDMKNLGFLYTNDELETLCHKKYGDFCVFYAFNIPAMLRAGYIPMSNNEEEGDT